ncbi:16866_t:CDS:2 [Cetraspora pellucida]|uniref:16866_t:CDS:1 n=1 Tax=Cetraspora pellucida TaxID=1433469 RepID=A0ACA9K2E9_9GLOM|nr:16866_t:CDS:2 [Cetraspora pellucida]
MGDNIALKILYQSSPTCKTIDINPKPILHWNYPNSAKIHMHELPNFQQALLDGCGKRWTSFVGSVYYLIVIHEC